MNFLKLHTLVMAFSEYAHCIAFLLNNLMSAKDTLGAAEESSKDGLSAIRNIMVITAIFLCSFTLIAKQL